MSLQIVKQDNELFGLFSTYDGVIVGFDLDEKTVIAAFVQKAQEAAAADAQTMLQHLKDNPNHPEVSIEAAVSSHMENQENCSTEQWNKQVKKFIKNFKRRIKNKN